MAPFLRWVLWMACLLAALAEAVPASAAPPPQLRRARNLYEYGDYQAAIPVLEDLLLPGKLEDEADLVATHRMLGVAYHQLGRLPEAEREFKSLLYLDPDAQLDPFLTPPDVVEFFERVKADMHLRLPQLRETRAREKAERDAEKARALAARTRPRSPVLAGEGQKLVVRRIRVLPWPVLLLPAGIPQFLMGHWVRGAIVLGLVLVSPLPHVAIYWAGRLVRWGCFRPPPQGTTTPEVGLCDPRDPRPIYKQRDASTKVLLDALSVAQAAALMLVVAALAVGVVDALILPTREVVLEDRPATVATAPFGSRPAPAPAAPPTAAPAQPIVAPAAEPATGPRGDATTQPNTTDVVPREDAPRDGPEQPADSP